MSNFVMLMMIIASSLLITASTSSPTEGSKSKSVFNVSGKVLCQDCTQGWNQWVNEAKPIQGCRVSVTCLDERNRVVYYGSDLTDKAGELNIMINKYTISGKLIQAENCFLRLVSSPDPVCNIPTDFAGGKTGVKLGRPTVVYRELIKHVVGPFFYTTPMCDEPDTTTLTNDGDGDDSDDGEEGKETNY